MGCRSLCNKGKAAEDDVALADADPETCVAATKAVPDAGAIREEAIAHARAVVDLCRSAGQPQMAGRFLEEDACLDEVRAALLAAKADSDPEIAGQRPQPRRGSAARPGAKSSPAPSNRKDDFMAALVEGTHPGGFLVWEDFRDYTRETITIAAGTLEPGTVLDRITASGEYAAHDPDAVDGTETAVAVLWARRMRAPAMPGRRAHSRPRHRQLL